MSRIAKNPVVVPEGVTVMIEGQTVTAKGKLGELSVELDRNIAVEQKDGELSVTPLNDHRTTRSLWGTSRSLLNNIVTGVSEGFKKDLELRGVGYRAQLQGNVLVMQLGFSHDVRVDMPEGIKFTVPSQTEIEVSGADKQRVGQIAANIRSFRPPEPYKGKGVRYKDEYVAMKEGKKK